ncbi:AAA family ATPase [Streptomyces sp. NPDC005529]|uniref:helix-turn-helix transcriptional regulator n=1 Tax=unclassified Streptomyces TaxID=2593676 RepID=UPI0033A18946
MDGDESTVASAVVHANASAALWEGEFAGRAQELALAAQCRAQAVAGTPWIVVIEGEPGIGKTALARRAVAAGPDGMRVYWSGADRSEQDYPYGVVDQLLRRLPSAHGTTPDAPSPSASPFSVGSDLLTSLADAAGTTPLAVVIDDIQWADEPSLKALAFMLRRLHSEAILIVFTARIPGSGASPDQEPRQLAQGLDWHAAIRGAVQVQNLRLAGLSTEETAQMVDAIGAGTPGPAGLARLQKHTGGHPLYLRSLLAEVSDKALTDLTRPLPVPSTLDALVRRRLDHLPADARRLTEALAVLEVATPLAVTAQLAELSDATDALGVALASGLVQWQPGQPTTPLRIHHPLQRDAVYNAISPTRRRVLHLGAAALVDSDRAWDHKVAAASTADPDLAHELATEAERQAGRGHLHRAATLHLWAADVGHSGKQFEHHLIAAATYLLVVQAMARVRTLRPALESCAPGPARDAVLGYLAGTGGDFATAETFLAPAVEAATDPSIRLTAGSWLGHIRIWRADGAQAAAALRPVVNRMPPGPAAANARGLLAWAAGYADGAPAGLALLAGLSEHASQVARADSLLLSYRGGLRVRAGQLMAGVDDLATLAARQREDDNLVVAPLEHYMLGFGRYLTGHWVDATLSADHALLVADIGGQPYGLAPGHAVAAMVNAQQGHQEQAEKHLAACRQTGALFPDLSAVFVLLAEAAIPYADADWPATRSALRPLDDPAFAPGMRTILQVLWIPPYVEALTAGDRPSAEDLQRAEDALRKLDRIARRAPALTATSHWLHGRLAAAHGDTKTAQAHYSTGLAAASRDGDDIPLHRAFLHRDLAGLHHDQATATRHLQQAHHLYTELGAAPQAQRAARDLALLDAVPPVETPVPAALLTEREQAVAHRAARGLTNQEIARELFISPKTVEYHLGHVYTKLSLASRRQLRTALRTNAEPREPV